MGTQEAAAIRQELKKRFGWGSRQISVRADHFSMGSAVDVTIKDASISINIVEAIAKDKGERIHRCEITGDILGGGNTYIHVNYTEEAKAEIGAPYFDALKAAVEAAQNSGGIEPIEGTDLTVSVCCNDAEITAPYNLRAVLYVPAINGSAAYRVARLIEDYRDRELADALRDTEIDSQAANL